MTTEFADVPPGETSLAARRNGRIRRLVQLKKQNEKAAQPREHRLLYRNQINLNILCELG